MKIKQHRKEKQRKNKMCRVDEDAKKGKKAPNWDEHKERIQSTAEVRGKKIEKNEERMGFYVGGCDGFVGHVSPGCHGAPV